MKNWLVLDSTGTFLDIPASPTPTCLIVTAPSVRLALVEARKEYGDAACSVTEDPANWDGDDWFVVGPDGEFIEESDGICSVTTSCEELAIRMARAEYGPDVTVMLDPASANVDADAAVVA